MKFRSTAIIAGTLLLFSAGMASAADATWRYVGVINSAHDYAQIMIKGFKKVEERTGGALKINYVSYGETPYKPVDALTLLRDGLVEMSEWLPSYNAATYPLLAGPELPFVMPKWEQPAALQKVAIAAWATPTIKAYKQNVLNQHGSVNLMTVFYDPINLWFAEPITDIAAMKGKKVRATSPEQAELLTALGASPVNIAAGDAYTGLQRGVINGIVTGAAAVVSFKWDEVLKSGFATNVLMSSTSMLVSKKALDSLPEGTRKILLEEMARAEAEIHAFMPGNYTAKIKQLRDKGVVITEPSPAMYQQFRQFAVNSVHPSWAKRAGGDAQKMLAEIADTK